MKKIAIIRHEDALPFVGAVNDFYENHNIIDIKFHTHPIVKKHNSDGVSIETVFVDTAIIIYEE